MLWEIQKMMRRLNKANPTEFVEPSKVYKCPTKVAVLLASYNGEKYIAEQIDSILNQDCEDWTLYISDDGSTDKTNEIIDSYVKKYPDKIVRIDNQKHQGCSNNFYGLIFSVDAPYYMICDQDDVWIRDKIRKSLDTIKNYDDKPILAAAYAMVCDGNLNPIESDFWYKTKMREKLLTWNWAGVCCSVAGAETIFNNKLKACLKDTCNNPLTYDHWILMTALKYGQVVMIPFKLRLYRQHDDNILGANTKYNKDTYKNKIKQIYYDYYLLKEINYGNLLKYLFYKFTVQIRLKIHK